ERLDQIGAPAGSLQRVVDGPAWKGQDIRALAEVLQELDQRVCIVAAAKAEALEWEGEPEPGLLEAGDSAQGREGVEDRVVLLDHHRRVGSEEDRAPGAAGGANSNQRLGQPDDRGARPALPRPLYAGAVDPSGQTGRVEPRAVHHFNPVAT